MLIGPTWRRLLRLVAAGSALVTPASGQFPSAEQCAFFNLEALESVVNVAYDIAQAIADCTLPGLVEVSCASDITDMMSWWFQAGEDLCAITLACGNLDNTCAAQLSRSLVELSDCSTALIAAASDCTSDAFMCTFDVVEAIDKMNRFIGRIIAAFDDCQERETLPQPGDLFLFNALGFRRRLSMEEAEAPTELARPATFEANESLDLAALRTQARASLGVLFDVMEARGVDVSVERHEAEMTEDAFSPEAGLVAVRARLHELGRHLRTFFRERRTVPMAVSRFLNR